MVLSFNGKPAKIFQGARRNPAPAYLGPRRALPAPSNKLVEHVFFALCFRIDAAVRFVPDKTFQIKLLRSFFCGCAEKDSLNMTRYFDSQIFSHDSEPLICLRN